MTDHFAPHIFFGFDPMVTSTALLLATYAVIIWDKLNRAIVALLAASLMVIIGALDQTEALKGIDWNTIGLLTGMMMLVSISRRSGMFQYLAIWSAQKANANPGRHPDAAADHDRGRIGAARQRDHGAAGRAGDAGDHSRARIAPYPFLFAEVFASNIGGTATLIGDPPNILIGSLAGLDFNAFVINLPPVILRRDDGADGDDPRGLGPRTCAPRRNVRSVVMGMSAKEAILDWTLLKQSLTVLVDRHRRLRDRTPTPPRAGDDRHRGRRRADAARQLAASQREAVRERPQDAFAMSNGSRSSSSSACSSWCTAWRSAACCNCSRTS